METYRLINNTIKGKKIYLRPLTLNDVTDVYFKWLQDRDVIEFLEDREENKTLAGLRRYVSSILKSKDNFFFGIFIRRDNRHIGNIKIGRIHKFNKSADLGILIGDKMMWGKGYGTEAIQLATKYAFKVLRIHKLFAGINELNISSYKAFIKAGYKKAGRLKEQIYFKGKYIDSIIVERINNNET